MLVYWLFLDWPYVSSSVVKIYMSSLDKMGCFLVTSGLFLITSLLDSVASYELLIEPTFCSFSFIFNNLIFVLLFYSLRMFAEFFLDSITVFIVSVVFSSWKFGCLMFLITVEFLRTQLASLLRDVFYGSLVGHWFRCKLLDFNYCK